MFTRLALAGMLALAMVPTRALVEPGSKLAIESRKPFCERNPHTCGAIQEVWLGLRTKALLVAGSAYRIVVAEIAKAETGAPGQGPLPQWPPHAADLKGTLNARDRALDWQAPPQTDTVR
ncbi:MAG: hypothetical protein AAGJ53_03415 [Pseudomonadota bacterium]